MLKQVFFAHFEPMVTHFGPWKIPKCLENGSFWEQKVEVVLRNCVLFSQGLREPASLMSFAC